MDKIVFQYDSEAKARVEKLKDLEFGLFYLTLFNLIMEVIFIFRPIYYQINNTIKAITDSKENLQKLNGQLRNTNEAFLKTKNELIRATKEKYKLQIKEDKIRSASLIEGQEEKRKRLALELHDGIGQMLTGLKLISEKFNPSTFSLDKDRKTLEDFKQLLLETIAETRTVSFNLMPSVLNDFGILPAIRILSEQTEKNTGLKITLNSTEQIERLPQNIEVTIYRIVQEAINNTLKHSNATLLSIQINYTIKLLTLLITDNGKGFDVRKLRTKTIGSGVKNIRSRTEINNGQFKISSSTNKGTRILVKLPLEQFPFFN